MSCGNASKLIAKAYMCSSCIPNELWKCKMILELIDCMYDVSQCGLLKDEIMHCIDFLASD